MVVDPKLSDNVSLSLVLDELLYSNESPDVVMTFLKGCGSSLGEVLSQSLCSSKITNLDFFRKITSPSGRSLFRKIIEEFLVGYAESWMFVVQLSKTGKDAVRMELGVDPKKICQKASLRGPIPRIVDWNDLDLIFLEDGSNVFYAAEKVNSASDMDLNHFLATCSPFLFQGRICQEDFFSSLSDGKKWIFFKNFFPESYFPYPSVVGILSKFSLQLLSGSDKDIRKTMLERFLLNGTLGRDVLGLFPWFGSEDVKRIAETGSFPELYMEYAISGIESFVRPILIYLIITNRIGMALEFAENEPELLEKYLPIGDLIADLARKELVR